MTAVTTRNTDDTCCPGSDKDIKPGNLNVFDNFKLLRPCLN